jgi:hypothetical protein
LLAQAPQVLVEVKKSGEEQERQLLSSDPLQVKQLVWQSWHTCKVAYYLLEQEPHYPELVKFLGL